MTGQQPLVVVAATPKLTPKQAAAWTLEGKKLVGRTRLSGRGGRLLLPPSSWGGVVLSTGDGRPGPLTRVALFCSLEPVAQEYADPCRREFLRDWSSEAKQGDCRAWSSSKKKGQRDLNSDSDARSGRELHDRSVAQLTLGCRSVRASLQLGEHVLDYSSGEADLNAEGRNVVSWNDLRVGRGFCLVRGRRHVGNPDATKYTRSVAA
jgi:hypothetical protein